MDGALPVALRWDPAAFANVGLRIPEHADAGNFKLTLPPKTLLTTSEPRRCKLKCFRKLYLLRLRLVAVGIFLAAIASTIAFGELPDGFAISKPARESKRRSFRMMSLPAAQLHFDGLLTRLRPALGD